MCATNNQTNPEQKPDMTLYDYVTDITPSEKLQFYEETYKVYIERLLKTDERFALIIKDYEEMLNKSGTKILQQIFKRIVPTLDYNDNTPFDLLYSGLNNPVKGYEIDRLCVFLQIAGFRWGKIEKSFFISSNTRNWREGNKWKKTPEGKLLVSLFEDIRQNANGEYNVESFNNEYLSTILPMLIKHESILLCVYQNLIKYWNDKRQQEIPSNLDTKKRKEEISERISELEKEKKNIKLIYKEGCFFDKKMNRICDIVSNNQSIQDHFQYEYQNYCKNEEYIFFKSANRSFYLSELEETLWKKLTPWPDLITVLDTYYPHHLEVLEYSVPKKESLDFLKKRIRVETPSSNDNLPPAK